LHLLNSLKELLHGQEYDARLLGRATSFVSGLL
jgi:hypothetical protein